MSAKKVFLGSIGLLLLAVGAQQMPAGAQTTLENSTPIAESNPAEEQPISAVREPESDELSADQSVAAESDQSSYERAEAVVGQAEPNALMQPENLSAESLTLAEETMPAESVQPTAAAAELAYPAGEEPAKIAQARRRTGGNVSRSSDFIGIGADFGTAGDISFAAISKLSLSDQIAVRPSILVGDDFAVLVPVTYGFSRFSTNVQSFQILPYAGLGASYVDGDSSSDLGLLVSAGVDVPVSRQFTANAQANYAGIFSDNDNFGVTIGVGYNFSGFR